ncbi:MAG: isopentenyl phosphate kinase [Myxococcota bacterium]|nr:isopentenyl phosphate kinase [Myxococcota bacterium]
MTDKADRVLVKLGGSLVTDKASAEPRVDSVTVERLAAELAAAEPRPTVLIHGAGSFGHRIVERTGVHRGLRDDACLLAMGETQRLQYELDARLARLLMDAGLPVMPVQASSMAVMRDGELRSLEVSAIREMVGWGLIPLLYGVPAIDRERGCSILSGDQLAPRIAAALDIPLVIHATDVDGVYEGDPVDKPDARRIDHIHRGNWAQVRERLAGSHNVDVTGGMGGKIGALLADAREGQITRIVDGRIPGRLTAALSGEPVGTLVSWEEP